MNSAIINTELLFRPAQKSNCRAISSLYSISSDGVADYIWTKLAQPGEDLLNAGQRRYERENTVFSYRNCTIATLGETIIGMLVAFPMIVDADAEPEQDPILAPYSKLEANNSYYICDVAVFPEYRNRGIGTRLMAVAEQQAATKGFTQLSLIVFEQNKGAKRLYERLGYREIAREAIRASSINSLFRRCYLNGETEGMNIKIHRKVSTELAKQLLVRAPLKRITGDMVRTSRWEPVLNA